MVFIGSTPSCLCDTTQWTTRRCRNPWTTSKFPFTWCTGKPSYSQFQLWHIIIQLLAYAWDFNSISRYRLNCDILFQVSTLSNGLKVASVDSSSPTSRVGLFFSAGSRYETLHNSGISHVLRAGAFLVSLYYKV